VIPGTGFYAPDLMRRPKEQDQSAPWAGEFPRSKCWATTIRLPTGDPKWRWTYYARPIDRHIGDTGYWRASGLADGIMRTIQSTNIDRAEIDAAEAKASNDAIPGFNNNMSRVYQVPVLKSAKPEPAGAGLPFGDAVDWTDAVPQCSASAKAGG
jgi:hypothetical protein